MSEQTFTVRVFKERDGEPYSSKEVLDAIAADRNFRLQGTAIFVHEEPLKLAAPPVAGGYPNVEVAA